MSGRSLVVITAALAVAACIGVGWTDTCHAACPTCPGDVDGNGVRDGGDIQGFVDCLLGAGSNCECADMNGGGVAMDDIDPFVQALLTTDGPCPVGLNDNCLDAIEIIGDVANLPFDTTNATFDGPWPPPTTCILDAKDIWYRYTATCDGVALIDVCGSSFAAALAVFDGWACPPFQSLPESWYLVCGSGTGPVCGESQASVAIEVTTGHQYMIQIGGYYPDAFGPGQLTTACLPPPSNDECYVDLPLITPPQVVTGTTIGARLDCSFGFYPTVWYKIAVPHASNDLTFAACGDSASIYDAFGRIALDCNCAGLHGADATATTSCPGGLTGKTLTFNNVPGPGEVYLAVWLGANRHPYSGLDFSATINVNLSTGACCLDQVCQATNTESECMGLGGTWYHEQTCPAFDCTLGACCVAGGCQATNTLGECNNLGGTWYVGQDCSTFDCTLGACCVSENCIATNNSWECDNLGGSWHRGETCPAYQCALGACCVNLVCRATNTQAECNNWGGIWYAGQDCDGFTCPIPPPNDQCGNAIPIGNVTNLPFDTTNASFDGPGACTTSKNVWYCYTATCTGNAVIDLCGSTFDTKLAVYDGCYCWGPMLACNDDYGPVCPSSDRSSLSIAVIQGYQYLIEIGGHNAASYGVGALTINCSAPPMNDNCTDAILIGNVTSLPFDTTAATFDGFGNCMNTNDVWYRYTATCDGTAMIDLCGSSFATWLAVYDGWGCPPGSYLKCSADSGPVCGNERASVAVEVTTGQELLIEVGGAFGSFGTGDLTITCLLPPVNDDCYAELPLITPPQTVENQTTIGARLDCSFSFYPTVWYRIDLPYGCNDLTFAACGTSRSIVEAFGRIALDCNCAGLQGADATTTTSCPGGLTGKTLTFNNVPGPGEIYLAVYLGWNDRPYSGLDFSATISVTECTGACCLGTSCSVTTQANCSGTWTSGADCDPNPCTLGACCVNGTCQTTTDPAACAGLGGAWHPGATCPTFTCPDPTLGNACGNPYPISIPANLPFGLGDTTCGRGDDYTNYDSCLFPYDLGEDMIFQLNVTATTTVTISLLGSDPYWGWAVGNQCPPDTCLFDARGGSPAALQRTLQPGTYYLQVDRSPPPWCGSFLLTITTP